MILAKRPLMNFGRKNIKIKNLSFSQDKQYKFELEMRCNLLNQFYNYLLVKPNTSAQITIELSLPYFVKYF